MVCGRTYDNIANLAPVYIDQVIKPYEGTELGRQELNAEDLEDVEGALWKRALIEQLLSDDSIRAHPAQWAKAGVTTYHMHDADALIAEDNNGGQMVEVTISTVRHAPSVKRIHASRGKRTRAEPVSMLYEQGMVHHASGLMVTGAPMRSAGQPSPTARACCTGAAASRPLQCTSRGKSLASKRTS